MCTRLGERGKPRLGFKQLTAATYYDQTCAGKMEQNYTNIQGDPIGSSQPPVDFKTKVPLWPGQAKMELLF